MIRTLPDEILLEVLQYVNPFDLWTSARLSSRQMKHCVEDIFAKEIINTTQASLVYSLGSGSQRRWYDVRTTATFAFQRFLEDDEDIAIFELTKVAPPAYHSLAVRKWCSMSLQNVDSERRWIVELDFQTELPNDMFHVPLHVDRLEGEDSTAVKINWKHMYARFFDEVRQSAARYGDGASSELAHQSSHMTGESAVHSSTAAIGSESSITA